MSEGLSLGPSDQFLAIPEEVRELVGSAMTPENLVRWWGAKHPRLYNESPCDVWESSPAIVRNFILAARSGDAA